jgi:hypothetical protein
LLLEKRPPINNSASKEKARRCRDHFLPGFLGFFSERAAPAALRFLLLTQNNNRSTAAIAATTTGTATAALRAEEHDMLLQEDSETVTTPSLVLLAALLAVLEALSLILADAELPAPEVTVASVVPAEETEEPVVSVVIELVAVVEVLRVPSRVVAVNSLCKEERKLFMTDVPGPLVPVMPVKASVSWLSLSGMVEGVAKVFVKEKVLSKDAVGCVKVLENLSLRRATRGLERRRGERP